jgi:hypothetical protein
MQKLETLLKMQVGPHIILRKSYQTGLEVPDKKSVITEVSQ